MAHFEYRGSCILSGVMVAVTGFKANTPSDGHVPASLTER